MNRYLVVLLLAGASCGLSQSTIVYSPFGVVGTPGGGNAFLVPNTVAPSARSQHVYAASDFTRAIAGSPVWITELRFNPATGGTWGVDLQNIQIDLSTTPRAPDGLSAAFADNVGADEAVVYSGALRLYSDGGTYGVRIPLQTPFFFDPSEGNLLLDLQNFHTADPPPMGILQFEGADRLGDTVSRTLSFDVNSPTATYVDTISPFTAFWVTPIPEPGTVCLSAAGVLVLAISAWRRTRSRSGQPQPLAPQAAGKEE